MKTRGSSISLSLYHCCSIFFSLISQNPNIHGIKLQNTEIKITQYADDATLSLNGTLHSLSYALNTLEIFSSLSGLNINKDKTKMVWIGKKALFNRKAYERISLGE